MRTVAGVMHANRSAGAAAGALLGVALWAAAGTLAVAGPAQPRIGLLPPLWTLIALIGGGAALGWILARRAIATTSTTLALGAVPAALALLPWLPGPVPAAFLVWTRPLVVLAALVTALALAFQALRDTRTRWTAAFGDPRRAPRMAALLLAFLYGLAAWRVAPMIPGGDEPHYLIITQSLLYDFDLKIEDNHTRGDHRAYVAMDLRPDYVARGTDGEIYSIHMPGISALVAPAFLLGGHPGAAAFIVLMAALAGAVLWRIAFAVTASAGAAWFGCLATALSVPIVFHSFTLYPDSAATLPVLIGVLALLHASRERARPADTLRPWVLYGAALALLPWLHSRFALLAGGLGAFAILRLWGARGWLRKSAAFLALPVVSAAGWFAFFYVIYGSPSPRAQYGSLLDAISSPAFITSGIGGLLFDQQFGLLTHAPVYACAALGLAIMLVRLRRSSSSDRAAPARLAVETLLLFAPYTISTTTMRMWWGGWSAPARFLVPLLPLLGIAAAVAWQHASRRTTRAVMLGALAASIAMSAALVWVDRGRLAYDIRQTDALWLEWAGPLADLARGVPTFLRSPEPDAWLQTLVWICALTAAWLAVRRLEGRTLHSRAAISAALVAAYAAAGMVAVTIVWRMNASPGVQPALAQLDLLRGVAARRGIGVAYEPFARVALEDIPDRLTIVPGPRHVGGRDGQLMALPGPIPAGTYEVRPSVTAVAMTAHGPGPAPAMSGRLNAGIGRDFVPVWSVRLSDDAHAATHDPSGGRALSLDFPVDVRAIVIRGDEQASTHAHALAVRPRRVAAADRLPTRDFARQAVRYGRHVVYFLDEGVFAETEAFWVRGGRRAALVVHPDQARQTVSLFIRNAPVDNVFTLEAGTWREALTLKPGEERRIAVPFDQARGAGLIVLHSAAGFRPSEVEPSSTDQRFLGVWVRVD